MRSLEDTLSCTSRCVLEWVEAAAAATLAAEPGPESGVHAIPPGMTVQFRIVLYPLYSGTKMFVLRVSTDTDGGCNVRRVEYRTYC